MNIRRLFSHNPARELGALGLAERKRRSDAAHAKMIERTKQIRRELGLADDARLGR